MIGSSENGLDNRDSRAKPIHVQAISWGRREARDFRTSFTHGPYQVYTYHVAEMIRRSAWERGRTRSRRRELEQLESLTLSTCQCNLEAVGTLESDSWRPLAATKALIRLALLARPYIGDSCQVPASSFAARLVGKYNWRASTSQAGRCSRRAAR